MLDAGFRPIASMLLVFAPAPGRTPDRQPGGVRRGVRWAQGLRDGAYGRATSTVKLAPSGDPYEASDKVQGDPETQTASEFHVELFENNKPLLLNILTWIADNPGRTSDDVLKVFGAQLHEMATAELARRKSKKKLPTLAEFQEEIRGLLNLFTDPAAQNKLQSKYGTPRPVSATSAKEAPRGDGGGVGAAGAAPAGGVTQAAPGPPGTGRAAAPAAPAGIPVVLSEPEKALLATAYGSPREGPLGFVRKTGIRDAPVEDSLKAKGLIAWDSSSGRWSGYALTDLGKRTGRDLGLDPTGSVPFFDPSSGLTWSQQQAQQAAAAAPTTDPVIRAITTGTTLKGALLSDTAKDALQQITEFQIAGVIDKGDADAYRFDILNADDDAEVTDLLNYAKVQIAPSRSKVVEPNDFAEEHDLRTNWTRFQELLPDSVKNVITNITRMRAPRRAPKARNGLAGIVNKTELQFEYNNLRTALELISKVRPPAGMTPGRALLVQLRSQLAAAMARNADLLGVGFQVVDEPGKPYQGVYNFVFHAMEVNMASMRDIVDFHNVILHEGLHAYLTRLRLRFELDPSSLSADEREAIESITKIMEAAKANGLTWQNHDHPGQTVQFDEFVNAALGLGFRTTLRDDQGNITQWGNEDFQAKLAEIQVPGVSQPQGPQKLNLWQAFKEALAKLLWFVMRGQQGLQQSVAPSIEQTAMGQMVNLVSFLVDNYNEGSRAADDKAIRDLALLTGQRTPGLAQTGFTIGETGAFDPPMRYRRVDGLLDSGEDLTVDTSQHTRDITAQAMKMVAVTNELGQTFEDMNAAYQTAKVLTAVQQGAPAPQVQATQTVVKDMINKLFSGVTELPHLVLAAINKAMTDEGANPVGVNGRISGLEPRNEAPSAANQALMLLQKLRGRMTEEMETIRHAFGPGNITGLIATANAELQEVIKKLRGSHGDRPRVHQGTAARVRGILRPWRLCLCQGSGCTLTKGNGGRRSSDGHGRHRGVYRLDGGFEYPRPGFLETRLRAGTWSDDRGCRQCDGDQHRSSPEPFQDGQGAVCPGPANRQAPAAPDGSPVPPGGQDLRGTRGDEQDP